MVSESVFHPSDSSQHSEAAADGGNVNTVQRSFCLAKGSADRSVDMHVQISDQTEKTAVNSGLSIAMRAGGVDTSVGKLSMAILRGVFLKDAAERMGTGFMSGISMNTNLENDQHGSVSPITAGDLTSTSSNNGAAAAFTPESLRPPVRLAKAPMEEIAKSPEHVSAKADAPSVDDARTERKPAEKGEKEIASCWRKTQGAIDQAVTNRGRETNAFKSLHEYLKSLGESNIGEAAKLQAFEQALSQVSRIKDWDKPQWFRREPSNWRDPSGKRMTEHDFIRSRNSMTLQEIKPWDDWANDSTMQFAKPAGSADEKIAALDNYLVRRVSVDSVKNWLRRRPDESFVNEMFAALAENKLYLGENLRLRSLKDTDGNVRLVEHRDGKLYFEGSEDEAPVYEDARGRYVELPDDSDMVVFEQRTVGGKRQIVPISQPNDRDPNIQWFGGGQVKRGWQKEQRFLSGPQAFSPEELYGFFPDHFPMRVTNSVEAGKPTVKTGAAIYGYARDHAGRQARQLIADYGDVMDGLKRNNSQLINDARIVFGLQKSSGKPNSIEFDSPYPSRPEA
jgi:hypothetical protein